MFLFSRDCVQLPASQDNVLSCNFIPVGWMEYLRKGEVLNDADLDRFVYYI